jgi:hypothetical protein
MRIDRASLALWAPAILWGGIGLVALAALFDIGDAKYIAGPALFVPAIPAALLMGVPLGIVSVEDGFPALTVLGVILVYAIPTVFYVRMIGKAVKQT